MELLLKNKNNQILDLLHNKDKFIITKADNLHGIDVTIGETETPYADGSEIESVKALPRGIELTFKIIGDVKNTIDYVSSYIKSKQIVTLQQIEGDKNISIKGVINISPYSRMVANCELQISLYCGQPYWEDMEYIVDFITQHLDLLCFPSIGQYFIPTGRPFGTIDTSLTKSFENKSDIMVGLVMKINALGDVVNPRISCSTGEQNGYYMELNLTLQENDLLEICTIKNNKYIKINGSEEYEGQPVLDYFSFNGLDWLQLETGTNTFNITVDDGADNVYFSIEYKGRYE